MIHYDPDRQRRILKALAIGSRVVVEQAGYRKNLLGVVIGWNGHWWVVRVMVTSKRAQELQVSPVNGYTKGGKFMVCGFQEEVAE